MTTILARAARTVRNALTVDPVAARHLEKTYVDVALNSRLWGA
jgi:hypothetical protein